MSGSSWEAGFGRELRAYADELVRPWSAMAIAEAAVETDRSGWLRRLGGSWSGRRIALLAASGAMVIAASLFAVGGNVAIPTPSAGATPPATATPIPMTVDVLGSHEWGLDFAASGVSDEPIAAGDHVIPLWSTLYLNPPDGHADLQGRGGFGGFTGHGGGCDHFGGWYSVEDQNISFQFEPVMGDGCGAAIRARLAGVRSYELWACGLRISTASVVPDGCEVQLDLYDGSGTLLLAYRAQPR